MDTYADAAKALGEKIGSRNLELTSEPGITLIPKYSLLGKRDKYFWGEFVNSEQALQQLWQIADLHVEEVARLLGPR